MFRKKFNILMNENSKRTSFRAISLQLGIAIGVLIGFANFCLVFDALQQSSQKNADFFALSFGSLLVGVLSPFFSVAVIDYLINLFKSGSEYLSSYHITEYPCKKISFQVETLFHITLKNRNFYWSILSLSYYAAAIRIINMVINTSTNWTAFSWKEYYLTYVTTPVYFFFMGIILITVIYGFICAFQHRIISYLTEEKISRLSNKRKGFLTETKQIGIAFMKPFKSKVIAMFLYGWIPALIFLLYSFHFLNDLSFGFLCFNYLFFIVTTYIISSFISLYLYFFPSIQKKKNIPKNKGHNRFISVETFKNIPSSLTEELMDKEIQIIISEINQIVTEAKPYAKWLGTENIHILKRITKNEVVDLIENFNKLPGNTKEGLKEELLQRLCVIKDAAEKIVSEHHLLEFKKTSMLISERYGNKN